MLLLTIERFSFTSFHITLKTSISCDFFTLLFLIRNIYLSESQITNYYYYYFLKKIKEGAQLLKKNDLGQPPLEYSTFLFFQLFLQ